MTLSPFIVFVGIIVAATQLLFGAVLGWWLRGWLGSSESSDDEERSRLRASVDRLREVASSVAMDVGEHSSRVQAISDGLHSANQSGENNLDPAVLQAVAQIIEANDSLQKQLQSAQVKLQQQAHEIELHAADALTDALTGVANRRAFDRHLAQALSDWKTRKTPVSLVLLDVDHFKKFNDVHGHQAGDEVLREVAKVLQSAVREVDIVARYGGEEFAVILPGLDLTDAVPVAESIRGAVAEKVFRFAQKSLKVTASEGAAQALTSEDADSLIKRADEALYTSKSAGRNLVSIHDGTTTRTIRPHQPPASEDPAREAPPAASTKPARSAVHETPKESCTAGATDLQTGLPNRTAFFDELRRRLNEAQGHGVPLSVMLVRIDQYPDLIDRYGKAGVAVILRTLTQFLTAALRDKDLVARYEENSFSVLLPNASAEHARGIGDRLQAAIARCPLRFMHQELVFSVAVGVSESLEKDNSTTLLKRLEEQMTRSETGVPHLGNGLLDTPSTSTSHV